MISSLQLFRFPPLGYRKEVLRGENKLYLGNPAIAPAVLMKGKTILENSKALGKCVETAIMGHLSAAEFIQKNILS